MIVIGRHFSESNKRLVLWIGIALMYFLAQTVVYSQDKAVQSRADADGRQESTPWEHLTLEGALVIAVGVQYRENRQKEQAAVKIAAEMGAALAKNSQVMEQMTEALERMTERIARYPGRVKD